MFEYAAEASKTLRRGRVSERSPLAFVRLLVLLAAALCAVALALPVRAWADTTDAGPFTLTSDEVLAADEDYTFADGLLIILSEKPVTVGMSDEATDDVTYRDADGAEHTTTGTKSGRIVVAAGGGKTAQVTLDGVVIDQSENGGSAALLVDSGSLNLTLATDATSVLLGGENFAGLQNGTNPLAISGEGALVAIGSGYAAGIGGGFLGDASGITVSGGVISAIGGQDGGAGIGAGRGGSGSAITITGGSVAARGYVGGAAIGGGPDGNGSDITISGGTVYVLSTGRGAAIGGGSNGSGSDITISGGVVTAIGGPIPDGRGSAAIGGGSNGSGSDITISGGVVKATAGSGSACIGGGSGRVASNVLITGGSIAVEPDSNAEAIGSGWGAGSSIDEVTIVAGEFPADAYDVDTGEIYGITPAGTVELTSDKAVVTYSTGDFTVSGGIPTVDYEVERYKSSNVLIILTDTPLTIGMSGEANDEVTYTDVDGNEQTVRGTASDVIAIDTGSSDVTAHLTLDGVVIDQSRKIHCAAFIVESGELDLALAAGTTNVFKGGLDCAGLQNGSNQLDISGEGTLVAVGGVQGTGIGGGYGEDAGQIYIHGGVIVATGGEGGAGIGSGSSGDASNITISGGTVYAIGGDFASGIGGGDHGTGSGIEISGGVVTATGNGGIHEGGAGIGGGNWSRGFDITISGGSIKAAGGEGASVIGSGANGKEASGIAITGGKFADADADASIENDTVYGVKVASGHGVYPTNDPDYPVEVSTVRDDFSVEGGARGTDYTYENNVLTVLTDTPLTIGMSSSAKGTVTYTDADSNEQTVKGTTRDRIVIAPDEGVTAHVTLAGVAIDMSEEDDCPALVIDSGSLDLTLAADTTNVLKSGWSCAGLQNGTSPLSISGGGVLVAIGGGYGAGIGGGQYGDASNITIAGGSVTASGSRGGAGIGGGYAGSSSGISITGGVVAAWSDERGAGIGGGAFGDASSIIISGGSVAATGGYDGAGIGGGLNAYGTDITISGGLIKAFAGENASAIGSGAEAEEATNITITGGCFADENLGEAVKENSVYGVAVADGYAAYANVDKDTQADYPVAVNAKPALTLKDDLTSFAYDGAALEADDLLDSASYGETSAVDDVAFQYHAGADDSDVWTDGLPTNAGTYTVRATLAAKKVGDVQYASLTVSATVTIRQSATRLEDAATWDDTGNARSSFTYGETITVTAKPVATGTAVLETNALTALRPFAASNSVRTGLLALTEPASGQMALFYGDVQISAPADANADGTYTLTYDTTSKVVPVGEGSKIEARYVGTTNMAAVSAELVVEITPASLTPSIAGDATKIYDGTTTVPAGNTLAIALYGVLAGDSVSTTAGFAFAAADAGTKGVTATDIALAGDQAAWYQVSGTASGEVASGITPAQLTVTANDVHVAYNGAPSFSATVDGWVGEEGSELEAALLDALAYACDYEQGSPVGEYAVTPGWGEAGKPAELGNYDVTFVGGTLTVVQSGSWVDARAGKTTYTYGETVTVTATVGATGTPATRALAAPAAGQMALFYGDEQVSEAVDAGADGTYTMAYDTASKAVPTGEATLTARFVGDNNRGDASADVVVNIEKATLTPSVAGETGKVYDGTTAAPEGLSIALAGAVDGDDPVVASGVAYAYDRAGVDATKIVASGIALDGDWGNWYTVADTTEVEASVSPLMAELAWEGTEGRVYGDGQSVTAAVANAVDGDELSVVVDGGTKANAGTHTATAARLAGAAAGNYQLPDDASVEYVVAPAQLTVTANDVQVAYNGTPSFSATVEGWVAGDNELEDGLLAALAYDCGYEKGASAEGSTFEIAPAWADGKAPAELSNYDVTFVDGTLTVVRSATGVTVNADKASYTYGETVTVTATVDATGEPATRALAAPAAGQMALFYGDEQISEAVDAGSDGRYTMTYDTTDQVVPTGDAVLTARFVGDGNRDDAAADVTVNIEKATLTPSITGETGKVYDGTASVPEGLSVVLAGAQGDDAPTATASFGYDSADAGMRTVTASGIALDGDWGNWYTVAGEAVATGTIAPLPVELEWAGGPFTYDGGGYVPTASVKNLVSGDDVAVRVEGARTDAGDGTATAAELTGGSAGNYTLDGAENLAQGFSVNPAQLTVAARDVQVAYNGTPSFSATVEGWVGEEGDELEDGLLAALAFACDYEQGDPVGSSSAVTPGWGEAGKPADLGNYDVTFVDGTLTVVQSASGVTASTDRADGTYTYGEAVTVTATVDATGTPATRALLSAPAAGQMALFYGDEQVSEAVDAGADGTYTMTYDTADQTVPVGESTLTARFVGDGDRAGASADVSVTIKKATLTPSVAGDASKTYDGTTSVPAGLSVALDGVLAGDDVSATGSFAFAAATAGTKGVTAMGIALAGNDAGWYELSADTASGTVASGISKAPLTVSVAASIVTYGDVAPTPQVTFAGLVPGDTETSLGMLALTSTYEQYDDVGDGYTITPSGLSETNYDITYVPGTLTVVPRTVGLTWHNVTNRVFADGLSVTAEASGAVNGDVLGVTVSGGDATEAGGPYTATATALAGEKAGNYVLPASDSVQYTIAVSQTSFDAADGGFATVADEEGNPGNVFAYRELIVVTAKPVATGTAATADEAAPMAADANGLDADAPEAPTGGQMALFYTDESGEKHQISEAVDAAPDGTYTMTYDTTDKVVPLGASTVEACFVSDGNRADASVELTVNIAPAVVTTELEGTTTKTYDGTTTVTDRSKLFVVAYGIDFDDTVKVITTTLSFATANAGTGIAVSAPDTTLQGEDAGWYVLASTVVTGEVGTIESATPS